MNTPINHRRLLWTYISGFVGSVILTLVAYHLSVERSFSIPVTVAIISALAVVQLIVQLVFFLHLGDEPKPRWNLTALLFAVMVVVIIGFGSLWIMNNLSYNMHHGHDLDQEIMKDEAIYR